MGMAMQPNQYERSRSFWQSPLGIMLIGTVIFGTASVLWQWYEKRQDMSLEYQRTLIRERTLLLREFPTVATSSLQLANAWFARVVWLAEETNKPPTKATARNIQLWRGQVRETEAAYGKTELPPAILARIRVVYSCASVRAAAKDFGDTWNQYTDHFNSFNRGWNSNQKLTAEAIASAEASRKQWAQRLESLSNSLVERMTAEVFQAQGEADKCPP